MEIKKLIEKFFNGETTVEEERELKSYLQTHDLPADMQSDKELILFLISEPADALPSSDFSTRLEQMIDTLAREEEEKTAPAPKKKARRRIFALWHIACGTAAAACLALLFLLPGQKLSPKDTFTSPEEAAVELNNALLCIDEVFKSSEQCELYVAARFKNIGDEVVLSLENI